MPFTATRATIPAHKQKSPGFIALPGAVQYGYAEFTEKRIIASKTEKIKQCVCFFLDIKGSCHHD